MTRGERSHDAMSLDAACAVASRRGVQRAACRVAATVAMLMAIGATPVVGATRAPRSEVVAQPLRGIVKPVHQAAFTSDLATPIAAINFREGQRFRSGDVVAELDCARHRHDLEALASQAREMKVAVDSNEHLVRSGAANRNDVAVAKARHDRASAEHASMAQRLQQCRIVAPFDGVVTELTIHPHETPPVNQPFVTIVSHTALEIEIIVPSRLMTELAPAALLTFSIDETRRSYSARIMRLGGAVDPVSQTIKVYAGFVSGDDTVLPGMSGTAIFTANREVEK